ncbi:MAG: DnaJ domain-containing protein [Opitutales bacterium]
MFRRFDWFFQPDPAIGVTGPNGRDSTIGASESKEGKARQEERERQREERKLRQEERQKARDAKRTEDKARREKEKEDALREKAEKAANERARKVREAAEEVILEEDRLIELKHGKSLGLKGKLTPDEIKKKYRELMTQYHPDKVRGMGDEIREVAERKAKEINEAYDYFRKKYDL